MSMHYGSANRTGECEDGRYSIVKDETVTKSKKKTWTTKHKKQSDQDMDCIELNITKE